MCPLVETFVKISCNALDFGLGFKTYPTTRTRLATPTCFYALGVGLGFVIHLEVAGAALRPVHAVSMPSLSGWALQYLKKHLATAQEQIVSMPSVSGWALQ